jgi:hypothetical protein
LFVIAQSMIQKNKDTATNGFLASRKLRWGIVSANLEPNRKPKPETPWKPSTGS